MTKVTILGTQEKHILTPIKFVYTFSRDLTTRIPDKEPHDWEHIELITQKYTISGQDLMFCYNDNRNEGCLYVGYFNDGVV